MIEDCKIRFEEKLTAVIKKVKVDLQNLSEHAADLELLGDINLVQEYRKEAIYLSKRIKATEASIVWINEVRNLVN